MSRISYKQPFARHQDYTKGGGEGGGGSACHTRVSKEQLRQHYLKEECFCAVTKYSRTSRTAIRVAPFNIN